MRAELIAAVIWVQGFLTFPADMHSFFDPTGGLVPASTIAVF